MVALTVDNSEIASLVFNHSLEFAESWAGGSQFDPHHQNLSSHMMPNNSVGDCDANENLSYNQKNVKKWKKDEPLGELATISPVLFANICHPDLKTKYPGMHMSIS